MNTSKKIVTEDRPWPGDLAPILAGVSSPCYKDTACEWLCNQFRIRCATILHLHWTQLGPVAVVSFTHVGSNYCYSPYKSSCLMDIPNHHTFSCYIQL